MKFGFNNDAEHIYALTCAQGWLLPYAIEPMRITVQLDLNAVNVQDVVAEFEQYYETPITSLDLYNNDDTFIRRLSFENVYMKRFEFNINEGDTDAIISVSIGPREE